MNSSLYVGSISHIRNIPRKHRFRYPFFMWFLHLDEIDRLPSYGRWFSTTQWAISRFNRSDYHGDPSLSLAEAMKQRMEELTGRPVEGSVYGLMNMRTFGLYFSPVNFYYGYDAGGRFSHFLAEVSNIPWNERHQYAHYLLETDCAPENPKMFHVSPFNPMNQHYQWEITPPADTVRVKIKVDDDRGHIFTAILNVEKRPLTLQTVRRELLKKPVMTAYVISRIYWQALKLYLKGVPYVPYKKEAA